MSSRVVNRGAFLREQRLFPQEAQALSVEIDRAYVDVAAKVNDKVIGFYTTTGSVLTGEKWTISGISYSGLRQVYPFTAAGNIAHGLDLNNISSFTKIYGTFTDGTSWYPLPYVSATAANNQIQVVVTGTNIVITAGGGGPPTITKGYVVLEWISAS